MSLPRRLNRGIPARFGLTGYLWLCVFICLPSHTILAQSWTEKANLPTAREKMASCVIGHHIYAIGGTTAANATSLGTNERYDTQTDTWTARQAMPTPRKELTASAVDGKCYVIGGSIGTESTPVATLEIYDPATNQWSTGANMPTARFYPVSAAIDGIIYVAGGAAGPSQIFNYLQAYNPATNSWTTRTPMPTARAVSAGAALGGKLYVFGGTNSPFSQRFDVTEIYDPATNQWTKGASMPQALGAMGAQADTGKIFVPGGSRSSQSGVIFVNVYDPAADSWSTATALPGSRALHSVAFADGDLYVIGGGYSTSPPHPAVGSVLALAVTTPEPGFTINTGLSDAWYNPATDGQGFLITVFPGIKQVFLAWFTYDKERPSNGVTAILGEPGHRWLTAQGPYNEDTANLTIYLTSGGIFDAAAPPANTDASGYGTLLLEFADCSEGLITYEITTLGISGEIPIQRIVPDNIARCESLNTQ